MSRLQWTSDHDFSLDGQAYRVVDHHPGEVGERRGDELLVLKQRDVLEHYEALLEADAPANILELGIFAGGSTALLAQLAPEATVVALDLRPRPCRPLEGFIAARDLSARVHTHYGIDQSNRTQLDEVLASFDGPVDLIVDDASHLEPLTRASFDHLFPRLRPGGAYIIEDWSWAHVPLADHREGYQDVTPLSALVCQLVLATASRPQVVAEVVIDDQLALARRGPADLRSGSFDLASILDPVGREMVERMSLARTLTP